MVLKFFNTGKNRASSAVQYLTKDPSHLVLKGDLNLTQKIADSISRKYKYTSGVLSFEEGEFSTEKKLEIIQKFEKTFFAGLKEDNYNISWVEHSDKNRVELHFLTPRMELTTGKDLTIYLDKFDRQKAQLFRDKINDEYSFSSPMELDKREMMQEPKKLKNNTIESINAFVLEEINKGSISSRADIVLALEKQGLIVHREGKDYLSVKTAPEAKAFRLKGAYYSLSFSSFQNVTKVIKKEEDNHVADLKKHSYTKALELEKLIGHTAEKYKKLYANPPKTELKEPKLNQSTNKETRNDLLRAKIDHYDRNTTAGDRERAQRISSCARIIRETERANYRAIASTVQRQQFGRNFVGSLRAINKKIDNFIRSIAPKIDELIKAKERVDALVSIPLGSLNRFQIAMKKIIMSQSDKDALLLAQTTIENVKIAIEIGASITKRDKEGNTLLLRAAAKNDYDFVQKLHNLGFDPSVKNYKKQNILHLSSDVKILEKYVISVEKYDKDVYDKTPFEYLQTKDQYEALGGTNDKELREKLHPDIKTAIDKEERAYSQMRAESSAKLQKEIEALQKQARGYSSSQGRRQ